MKIALIPSILEKGQIKSISLEEGIGSTGEAHLALLDGAKYVLRICPDEETANKYLGYYKKFKRHGFFPRLLETRGKYMLFEFINGRMAKESEEPEFIFQVGKICALINKVRAKNDYQKSRKFYRKLEEIKTKKIISDKLALKAEEVYRKLDERVFLKASLDAGDVTNDNFMVGLDNKVYFVDIEAIKPNIKGMGIAKAFSTWFKTTEAQKEFMRGYESISSMDFYTEDYAKMTTLIFFVQRIRFKAEKGEQYYVKRTINKLERLLEKK